MPSRTDDYTKYRSIGVIPYEVDDMIGRNDSMDKVMTTAMTISGTVVSLPTSPLPRRNYIRVNAVSGSTISILSSASMTSSDGVTVVSGTYWEDHTDAPLYVVSTGASSSIRVYERAQK
jgi:hypothetical protein